MSKTLIGPVSIRGDIQFPDHVKTESVHAPFVDDRNWVHHIAGAFAHFLSILLPPTMREHLLGQRQPHGLEHDRPIHRMKLNNILPYHVNVGWPQGERVIDAGGLAAESL